MRGLECALVSALEPIIGAQSLGHIKGFAGNIFETTTARVVEFWSPQRFAIAAAMAHAQATVLPEFAFRAEALRRMDISTEATSADWSYAWHRAQQLDLRKGLRRPQHQ